MHRLGLCCERVLANAGEAFIMLRAVGRGGCARGCSGWWGMPGAIRGAAVCAGNQIGEAGAASLAPSLGRMAQLTSLDLRSTLRAIGWACAVNGCLRAPAMS
jgi:hypothetical protein